MATTTHTLAFTADAEGLTDQGGTADITWEFSTYSRFVSSTSDMIESVETARNTTGETWEDWGVPAGGTVTAVQITDFEVDIVNSSNRVTANTTYLRLVDDGGTAIHTGDLHTDTTTSGAGGWATHSAGTQQSVTASYQESTQLVSLYLTQTLDSGSQAVGWEWRLRNVDFTITYTPSGKRFVHVTNILVGLGLLSVALQAKLLRAKTIKARKLGGNNGKAS
jgi:hypothetical protein